MSRCYQFRLNLTLDECHQYYQGYYSAIQVMAFNGQTVQFPAEHIRQFVTSSGLQGTFELEIDDSNKFKSLKKLSY